MEPLRYAAYERYEERDIPTNTIPLLIFFPQRCVPIDSQLYRVIHRGQYANMRSMLSTSISSPGVVPTDKPGLIFGVDDGSLTAGSPRNEAPNLLSKADRLPCTVEEGLALLTQYPEIFQKHSIDLWGSKCGFGGVPSVYLVKTRPEYSHSVPANMSKRWGAPSCEARFVA